MCVSLGHAHWAGRPFAAPGGRRLQDPSLPPSSLPTAPPSAPLLQAAPFAKTPRLAPTWRTTTLRRRPRAVARPPSSSATPVATGAPALGGRRRRRGGGGEGWGGARLRCGPAVPTSVAVAASCFWGLRLDPHLAVYFFLLLLFPPRPFGIPFTRFLRPTAALGHPNPPPSLHLAPSFRSPPLRRPPWTAPPSSA